jgi:heme-degrading monooxygenase HmoA
MSTLLDCKDVSNVVKKEGELMIKVIIKRRAKKEENIAPLLRRLRATAMLQRGYVTGETLLSIEDRNVIVIISTWRSLEDWRRWEGSEQRSRVNRQIEPHLDESLLVETYEIMSTEEQDYMED